MVGITINGVDVDFPFQPYECQKKYMEKVMECLQRGSNGVLESPTGTGKTLCLLCATLAWRETYAARMQFQQVGKIESEFGEQLGSKLSGISGELNQGGSWERGYSDIPKIIYASRTHSQLSQAISELKNTRYSPKVCVLGSREQMCIHSEVMKEETNNGKVHLCRVKVASRNCFFYNNLEANKATVPAAVMDIEDLVAVGTEKKFCPYYMARELRKEADLIFMPYNYVLDFKARRAHGIDLSNTIILLDEAHNIESVCENNASFDLTSFDIASCIEDASQCMEILMEKEEQGFSDEASPTDLVHDDALLMKNLFLQLETFIADVKLNKNDCVTKSAGYLFEELSKMNITTQSKDQILEVLEKMSGLLAGTTTKAFKGKTYALDKFAAALRVLFARSNENTDDNMNARKTTQKFYKVHIYAEKETKKQKSSLDVWSKKPSSTKTAPRTLSYWCFNPGLTLKELLEQGVRSLILTSGTLSPLPSFKQELQIPFTVELENSHVIEKHQVLVGVVPQGPDGQRLNSSYKFRSTPEYQISMGNTIVNLSRIIPHGLLVFFPSYPVMDMVLAKWQECGIWNRISVNKGLFVEPRKKAGLIDTMDEFYEKINDPTMKGAIFFAVCRGKVSEGLDFADSNGRAVVITGLPFPPSFDPRVILKMQYLDENKTKDGIDSKLWYRQQASRAVNQAIGRVIRHKNDYGAILLCDERFQYADAKNHLPCWIKHQTKDYKDFGQAQRDLVCFFRDTQQKMGPTITDIKPKRKLPPSNEIGNDFQQSKIRKLDSHNKKVIDRTNCASDFNKKTISINSQAANSLAVLDAQTEKKSSIFEKINNSEKKNINSSEISVRNNSTTSISHDSRGSTSKSVPLKTKKYKLVKSKESKGNTAATASSTDSKKSGDTETLSKAREYLVKVKSILPKERYEKFGTAMKLYKQSGNVKVLVSQFESVFDGNNLEHFELMEGFGLFIKKENDKKYFQRACEQFSGS